MPSAEPRLYIQLGSRCNNDCIFCAVADSRHLPNLSLSRALQHLELGAAQGMRQLTISGGEPTLRTDLDQIVAAARRLGFVHIQVQTNARALASRSKAEHLFAVGVDIFLPSIHGPNATLHDAIVRASGAFDQTIRGIANIVALQRAPVNTNTVITKQNYASLPELAALLIGIGVKQLQMSYVQAEGNAKNTILDIGPAMTEAFPYLLQVFDIADKANIDVLVDGIPQCIMFNRWKLARDVNRAPRVSRVTDHDEIVLSGLPGKLKLSDCAECVFSSRCGGVWEKYVEMYGWSEFRPVRIARQQ